MRKRIVFVVVCSALLIGGCGGISTSSSSSETEQVNKQHKVDDKLVHRFEQRGFEVEGMVTPISEEKADEEVMQQTPAEKMAEQGAFTLVKLIMNEEATTLFNEQTVQYFKEDLNEKYPPPKKNTIDAIATVIYKNDDGFILDGIIRNGFHEQSFTLEQLQPLVFKLLTATNQPWITTTLGKMDGLKVVKSKEAVPFRLVIPKEKVRIPEFDYLQYSYHAVVEQPTIKQPDKKGNVKNKEE